VDNLEITPPEGGEPPEQLPADGTAWTWNDVVLMSMSTVAVIAAGSIIIFLSGGFIGSQGLSVAQPTAAFSALLAAVEAVGIIFSVYYFGLRRRGLRWRDLGLVAPGGRWLIGAGFLAVLALPTVSLIATGVRALLGEPLESPQMDFLAPNNLTLGGAVGMLAFAGVIVPFAEELFFRGVLYRWLRSHWKPWAAGLVSSMVFGLLHGEFSLMIATSIMGLILAWFYERSKSLWPSVVIHMVNNSLSILVVYLSTAFGLDVTGVTHLIRHLV
jgi:membrane protease YdiL (CAAX protease family)